MAQGVKSWSTTAASNGSADATINFAEGQSPSSVNDSARALMARVKEWYLDFMGAATTGGTATAFTLTSNQVFASLSEMDGKTLRIRFNAANGAAATLNVDTLGAKALQAASGTALTTGVIGANTVWACTYDNSIPAFIVNCIPAALQAGQSVALANIASIADGTVLGNISGGSAAPIALTLGAGFNKSGSTISAPAFPPAAAFKNLSIKVASNTTVTVAADFVTVTDGTAYQTLAFSSTVNLGTTGADALDTGTIAIDTWYAIWAIAKADGTAKCLASTSFTAPTMPATYTFKARIGAVQTIHGSATLYGTWQLGRRGQYVAGLAQTSVYPVIATGTTGASWTAASVTRFVPSTASVLFGSAVYSSTSAGTFYVNSNNVPSVTAFAADFLVAINVPTTLAGQLAQAFSMILESTNIYWLATQTSHVVAFGWEDNI